jgi:hypothetical protein
LREYGTVAELAAAGQTVLAPWCMPALENIEADYPTIGRRMIP